MRASEQAEETRGDSAWVWPTVAVFLVFWLGIAAFLFPFDSQPVALRVMALGCCLSAGILFWAAGVQLAPLLSRWTPAREDLELEASTPLFDSPTTTQPTDATIRSQHDSAGDTKTSSRTDEPDVHLGRSADPAFPLWGLRWRTASGDSGLVVLPTAPEVILGRSDDCHIVVRSPEVSREQLSFMVEADAVEVYDMGSKHGTTLKSDVSDWLPLDARSSVSLRAYDELGLISRSGPGVIILVLEPWQV